MTNIAGLSATEIIAARRTADAQTVKPVQEQNTVRAFITNVFGFTPQGLRLNGALVLIIAVLGLVMLQVNMTSVAAADTMNLAPGVTVFTDGDYTVGTGSVEIGSALQGGQA